MEKKTRESRLKAVSELYGQMKEEKEKTEKKAGKHDTKDEDSPSPSELLEKMSKLLNVTAEIISVCGSAAENLTGAVREMEQRHEERPCGSESGTMVMIAFPDGDCMVLPEDEAREDYRELFPDEDGIIVMSHVPGEENLYFSYPEKAARRNEGKLYITSPVLVCAVNEAAGEFLSPTARRLNAAAGYFESAASEMKLSCGRTVKAFRI